jgi:uncharacterized protein YwqG
MIKRKNLTFIESSTPVTDLVTKLGGQPNWLLGPEWPISRELGTQMRFIGQIKIDKNLFPESQAQMAYIFITDDEDFVDGTWEPDGGENAIILQPGNNAVKTISNATGPTLQNYIKVEGRDRLHPVNIELTVNFEDAEDPVFIPEDDLFEIPEHDVKNYYQRLDGNKIGGTPGFLQGDKFPDQVEDWQLLLQLDSCSKQYFINFGDGGISYSFINKNGTKAKFLWQCG